MKRRSLRERIRNQVCSNCTRVMKPEDSNAGGNYRDSRCSATITVTSPSFGHGEFQRSWRVGTRARYRRIGSLGQRNAGSANSVSLRLIRDIR